MATILKYAKIKPERGYGSEMVKVVALRGDNLGHEADLILSSGERVSLYTAHLYQDKETIKANAALQKEKAEKKLALAQSIGRKK